MSTTSPAALPGKASRLGEGKTVMVLGMPHHFKVASDENIGGAAVMEVVVAPGQGVPPHIHAREDEFFTVLQGELTCQMEGMASPVTLKAGDFLFLPRNRAHGFTNASGKEARMMVTIVPGSGSDRMFAELGKACEKFADPAHLMPEVGRICQSHGVTFAPPKK